MATPKFQLTIDQSLNATSATVRNKEGNVITSSVKEYNRKDNTSDVSTGAYAPRGIIDDMCDVVISVLGLNECAPDAQANATQTVTAAELSSVTFTHQPNDVIVWDITDGLPICDALSDSDDYAKDIAKQLSQKCNITIEADSVLARLSWILTNIKDAHEKSEKGLLRYGNPSCWMLWNLSGGVNGLDNGETKHVITTQDAQETGLYNVSHGTWDEELCNKAGIPLSILPTIAKPNENLAQCRSDGIMPGVPIVDTH
ncbi:MAG: hypothetical protein J6M18_02440 [Actinomycetaceae bacterium]|nr:hypothetical protein [Actinomycetaceae bacterium]